MEYKFSTAADKEARKKLKNQFGADPEGGVSRPYVFAKRVKAQMDRREAGEKLLAKRKKIAGIRGGY